MDKLQRMAKKTAITEELRENYLDVLYNRIPTDDKTFSEVLNFIVEHKSLYAVRPTLNTRSAAYIEIEFVGGVFFLPKKKLETFTMALNGYLNKKKCNKKIVEALSTL
jgi:hypothetical protein